MPKTKAELKAEFLKLGGDPAELPEDLTQISAAELQAKIEALELQRQLEQAEAKAQTQHPPEQKEEKPAENAPKEKDQPVAKSAGGEGTTFTLVKANQFVTIRLPGKVYNCRVPVVVTDPKEAEILRKTGLFEEGE